MHYQSSYAKGDNPAGKPSGAPITIDYGAVHPIRVNAEADDYPAGSAAAALNDAFNRQYTIMLRHVHEPSAASRDRLTPRSWMECTR